MAIGRTFEESFQKALRMVHPSVDGFVSKVSAIIEFWHVEVFIFQEVDLDAQNNLEREGEYKIF